MPIISYAQNSEDVMLWRALKNVKNGFYIDVGANDPVEDSVTKLFYDHGWSGINIEPLKSHFEDLVSARPRDVNINAAASDQGGSLNIWECEIRGWATADKSVADIHEANGHAGKWYDVPAYTMKEICDQYCDRSVHFMKIDVEGFEKAVLESMDFSVCRPWVLIVEATKPNSEEENYAGWEHIVLSADYVFAYSDGLNRFYVANERSDLVDKFKYPPNVFDGFKKKELVELEQRSQQLEIRAREAESKLQEAGARAQEAEARAQNLNAEFHYFKGRAESWESAYQQLQAQLSESLSNAQSWCLRAHSAERNTLALERRVDDLLRSTSWRITAPVRASRFAGTAAVALLWRSVRAVLRPVLSRVALYFVDRPLVLQKLTVYLRRYPRVYAHLRQFAIHRGLISAHLAPSAGAHANAGEHSFATLTPRAKQIYNDLMAVIAKNKEHQ